jgi:outer membrane immunogenic protein
MLVPHTHGWFELSLGECLSDNFENRIETADMGVTMKKLFLATTAMVALAYGSATAADLPTKARPLPPPPPPCSQFGGFYIGGNVGWGYAEHRFTDRDGFFFENGFGVGQVTATEDGFVGGVQGGYNWQYRCTLFGIEADYQWADIDHNRTFGNTLVLPGATLSVNNNHQGFGTVRARSGVIVDNLLLYVTGGLAYANFDRSVTIFDPVSGFSETFQQDNKTRWGWTFGFGTEWAAWSNWTIKSEVLYARFQRQDETFTCVGVLFCPAGATRSFERDDNVWVTRIGLNYRFGGYGGSGSGY